MIKAKLREKFKANFAKTCKMVLKNIKIAAFKFYQMKINKKFYRQK